MTLLPARRAARRARAGRPRARGGGGGGGGSGSAALAGVAALALLAVTAALQAGMLPQQGGAPGEGSAVEEVPWRARGARRRSRPNGADESGGASAADERGGGSVRGPPGGGAALLPPLAPPLLPASSVALALSTRPMRLPAYARAYVTYQPTGDLAEQMLSLRSMIACARALRRTLVLPHVRLPRGGVWGARGAAAEDGYEHVPFDSVFDAHALRDAAGGHIELIDDYIAASGAPPTRVMWEHGRDPSAGLTYFEEQLGWTGLGAHKVGGNRPSLSSVDIVHTYGPAQDTLLAFSGASQLFGSFAKERENELYQAKWLRALQPAEGLARALGAALGRAQTQAEQPARTLGVSIELDPQTLARCVLSSDGTALAPDAARRAEELRRELGRGYLCAVSPPRVVREAVEALLALDGGGGDLDSGEGSSLSVYVASDGAAAASYDDVARAVSDAAQRVATSARPADGGDTDVGASARVPPSRVSVSRGSDFLPLLPKPAYLAALDLLVLARTDYSAGSRFAPLVRLVQEARHYVPTGDANRASGGTAGSPNSRSGVAATQYWMSPDAGDAARAHFSPPLTFERLAEMEGSGLGRAIADRGSAKQASWLADLLEEGSGIVPAQREGRDVGIVTACMDRNDLLVRVLPSWLALEGVGEVVIVDWSSKESVQKALAEEYAERGGLDPRIRVVTVPSQERWVLSYALNLGVDHMRSRRVLKLDCDTIARPGLVSRHPDAPHAFYTGSWQQARTENELHLNGIMLVRRQDYLDVGGFNEHVVTYGYDDTDLYLRLEAHLTKLRGAQSGARTEGADSPSPGDWTPVGVHNSLRLEQLEHMQHGNARRQRSSEESQIPINARIQLNRLLIDRTPKWGRDSERCAWECEQGEAGGDHQRCTLASAPPTLEELVPKTVRQADRSKALDSWRRSLDGKMASGDVKGLFGIQGDQHQRVSEDAKVALLGLAGAVRTFPTPMLLVHVRGTLSMRLLHLAHGVLLARRAGRRLGILWKFDPSVCACSFDNIFAFEAAVLTEMLPPFMHGGIGAGPLVDCEAHAGAGAQQATTGVVVDGVDAPLSCLSGGGKSGEREDVPVASVVSSSRHVYLRVEDMGRELPPRGSPLAEALVSLIEALQPIPMMREAMMNFISKWDAAAGDAMCAGSAA